MPFPFSLRAPCVGRGAQCIVSLSLQWRIDLQWYLREVYGVFNNHIPSVLGVGQCCLVSGK